MKTRFTFIALVVAGLSALLSGCNTVHGFGQDVQRVGGSIERAAR